MYSVADIVLLMLVILVVEVMGFYFKHSHHVTAHCDYKEMPSYCHDVDLMEAWKELT